VIVPNVPLGIVLVAVTGQVGDVDVAGMARVTLASAASPLDVAVLAGGAVANSAEQRQVTASGFVYDLGCDGAVNGAVAVAAEIAAPFEWVGAPAVNGNPPWCLPVMRAFTLPAGRFVYFGPLFTGGLLAERRAGVSGGGHLLVADIFTNTTAQPIAVDVDLPARLHTPLAVAVSAAASGDRYVVTTQPGVTDAPALALVYRIGTDPAPSLVRVQGLAETTLVRTRVTVPAGGVVTLRRALALAPAGDATAAAAAAAALATGNDIGWLFLLGDTGGGGPFLP
jgi:hypothetical protein